MFERTSGDTANEVAPEGGAGLDRPQSGPMGFDAGPPARSTRAGAAKAAGRIATRTREVRMLLFVR